MKICPYCARETHNDICDDCGKVESDDVNVFAGVVCLLSLLGIAVCGALALIQKFGG